MKIGPRTVGSHRATIMKKYKAPERCRPGTHGAAVGSGTGRARG